METEKDRGALLLVAVGIIVESRNVLAQENRHVTLFKNQTVVIFCLSHIFGILKPLKTGRLSCFSKIVSVLNPP